LEDWIDYAIQSDCAPFSLAQFDNLAQKTRLLRLVVQGGAGFQGVSCSLTTGGRATSTALVRRLL
jgi:hypothetical protein